MIKSNRWQNYLGTHEFFGATAWVNFNGQGTVAIRDSENVSSITDNATGDYTVNFATAMVNLNYTFVLGAVALSTAHDAYAQTLSTTTIKVNFVNPGVSFADASAFSVAIFGGV